MKNDQSTFTAEFGYLIDQFDELQDLRWSDLQYLNEYRELKMKKNDGLPIDQNRLDQLELVFKNKIVTSTRWNKFQNALVGMQTFIKDEVEGFVLDKQQEIADYTNLKKSEVESTVATGQNAINNTKDAALISIENKKDNILDYMDQTTAGALRNDVGDMSQSTIVGRSLIDKTNVLKTQVDTNTDNTNIHDSQISNLSTQMAESAQDLNTHKSDNVKHITATERTTWNNKLNASAYTANDVLAKIKTVDGAGSGLDADLLDGKHASDFLYSVVSPGDFEIIEAFSDAVNRAHWNTSYTHVASINVSLPGVYRVSFAIRAQTGQTVRGRIYKNGVAIGTIRSTTSTTPVVFTEDLSINAGDILQLYTQSTLSGNDGRVYASSFKLQVSQPVPLYSSSRE